MVSCLESSTLLVTLELSLLISPTGNLPLLPDLHLLPVVMSLEESAGLPFLSPLPLLLV